MADESKKRKVVRRKRVIKKKGSASENKPVAEQKQEKVEEKREARQHEPKITVVDKSEKPEPRGKIVFKSNPFTDFLQALMDKNQPVIISPQGDGTFVMELARDAAIQGVGKLEGQEYWQEVLSPEFDMWSKEWNELTYSEKIEEAKRVGAEWEEHDVEKTNMMRMGAAVRDVLGIEKYKPKYRSRKARQAIRP